MLICTTAPLRYQLGDDYEYDFVDGPYPWPAAKGIAEVFGESNIYSSYFDGSKESAIQAVNDLADYAKSNGPFDAVMGFSLGAALAATLLLREETYRADPANSSLPGRNEPFKCAIFLCGILPADFTEVESKTMQLLRAGDIQYVIQSPTVHIWSPHDEDYPGQSLELVNMCEPSKRIEVLHGAGHSVPTQGEDLMNAVDAIRRTMESLSTYGTKAGQC